MAEREQIVVWQPQAGPQSALISCPVFEAFFGGARGGGKTDGMLGDWIEHAGTYGINAIGLMVRKERTQLIETIERSREIFTPLGAKFHEQDKMWRMPNGARLRFAYLERDADAEAYQGHSYTRVYVEEITNFPTPAPILKLMATLRSAAGVPVAFRATGNPGGPGHQWVKARYIDPAPSGWSIITDSASGLERVYIPSRVSDNAYLGADYVQRLKASGSEALVRAWLDGDWTVIEGAFFDCWSYARHVVRPFAIPEHWLRFRSMDWGSASPFSIGWWAVASEEISTASGVDPVVGDTARNKIPRGCLIRYREWYGASAPGVGLKLTAEEVADGIKHRERDEPKGPDGRSVVIYGVLDPSAFAQDGGPSIAERMARAGVNFKPADNRRVAKAGAMGGWDQVRARLKGDADGNPMMVMFSTCVDTIRTLPALQHDPDRPEDLDTGAEDHAADECVVAGTMISTARGARPIEQLRVGDMVQTRRGMRPVTAVFSSGEKDVYSVALSSGATITATANHPVWVEGIGYTNVETLVQGDILRSCESKSHSTARRSRAGRAIAASIFATIIGRVATLFTGRSGAKRTGIFLPGITFTMSTAIRSITTSQIWRSWLLVLMSGIIGQWLRRRLASAGTVVANTHWYTLGRLTVSAATHADQLAAGKPASTMNRASVPSAAAPLSATDTQASGFAHWRARSRANTSGPSSTSPASSAGGRARHGTGAHSIAPPHVVSVTPAGRQQVYNLSVSEAEEYFANGVLVHNCRYGAMSRPFIRPAPQAERPGINTAQPTIRDVADSIARRASGRKRI